MPWVLDLSWDEVLNFVRTAVEFLLIAFVIYKILYYLRGTRAVNVLAGLIVAFLALSLIAYFLQLRVTSWLLDKFLELMALAVIVIFQPELRRAFAQLGSYISGKRKRKEETINELMLGINVMSARKIGAIIVIERRIKIGAIEDDAIKLECKLNGLLLQSIFFPNSPLHDGAVIVRNDKIVAAGAILPLSRNANISRSMGTRHRAALGITEETDSVVLVVSEETGAVSIACQGEIKFDISSREMEEELNNLLTTDNGISDVLDNQDEQEGAVNFHGDQDPDPQTTAGEEK